MTNFLLNKTAFEVPASKSDFSAIIEKLSAQHTGLRERSLLFFMTFGDGTQGAVLGSRSVASMVGEGKYGTLHLLFEVLGRPDCAAQGFFQQNLGHDQIEALLSAFTPFASETQGHPNIDFLKAAQAEKKAVRVGLINHATDATKSEPNYVTFRTNALFELFNEGALRGSDGVARQAILDSFGSLPSRKLSAEGQFLVESEADAKSLIRSAPPAALEGIAVGGIDKFPSLMCTRGERLKADGNRIVPSAMIRDGVHVGKRNIFMFHAAVNIAAYIGDDNLIDSHASIASAAQIGNKNKIGSFVSLEGVLSPANAQPVYIGDDNFIGSFARIGTGLVLGNKNFIGAGVNLSKGTKIKDCRDESATKGGYISVQELNGSFNGIVIAPNNAVRSFNGVNLVPGEYILFNNTEEFMARFEGDDRIKAKA